MYSSGGSWIKEPVDPDAAAGVDLSASVGPDDVLHVLYSKRTFPLDCVNCVTLEYARRIAGNWQLSTLSDELLGLMESSTSRAIAAGAQGTLDVLSFGTAPGTANSALYHLHFDGTSWSYTQVQPRDTILTATNLRLLGLSRASDGSLHGVVLTPAFDGTESVTYLTKLSGAAWQSRIIKNFKNTDFIKPFASIAATSATLADIAVSGSGILHHLRISAGTITEFVLRNTSGTPYSGGMGYSALSAPNGQPLTAVYNLTANSNNGNDWYELWIARFDGAAWQNEKIYGTGKLNSGTPLPFDVDPPQVSYVSSKPFVFSKETGYFGARITDRQPLSAWTSTGSTWSRTPVVESQAIQSVIGKQIVAGADASGNLHSLHFVDTFDRFSDFDGGTLMYTSESNSSASSEIVNGVSAKALAVAVEPSGIVQALAGEDSIVTYLRRASGTWASESAGSVRHVEGSRPGMTLDSSGKIHACVYDTYRVSGDDFDHLRLRYLSNSNGWINEDIGGDLGRIIIGSKPACAIRVLAGGNVRVAYVDGEGAALLSASRAPTWNVSTVTRTNSIGPRIELSPVIDSRGAIHAAFTQTKLFFGSLVPIGIRYGTNADGAWAEEVVDDDSQLGISRFSISLYGSRIALAADNTIHVSYYDRDFNLLRASVKANGAWRNTVIDFTETAGKFVEPVPVPNGSVRFIYGVEMSASVRATRAVASPALFVRGNTSFPTKAIGQSASQMFTLANEGAQALSLNVLAMNASSDFAIISTGTTCTPSTVIQPGQGCKVNISFNPSTLGTWIGTLEILSNDPLSAFYLKLTGEGQPAATGVGPVNSPSSGGGGAMRLVDILLMLAFSLLAHRALRRSAIRGHFQ